ncbi:acetyl-CoA carboxylase biotin carboxyl carrier protein [Acetilactobacillus jinshanensis]|uniref:Biotin carboxyl carrier protein of acetyl-CoA carboxylase n=1 Tax=Acetilactobacillus jinshanensis TaxID=1720083 RepID=A0A4P6ZJP4_9LACO|nr:acetyl-CoA carboxylase biotin carboxyl carrier protein subunit [Acetilactobacillus jinshanensis]QBP17697.1 acetyl-CoA carboxylase biotin carboxyl carrier protein subunit [Acetilactobacillus jinshanensis]URL61759.1 acetyl-CoA carboxylase biotin carboxyl carrier protein subunit [uncultured bacterium]
MDEEYISKLMNNFEHSSLNELRLTSGSDSIYFSKLNQPGAVAQNNVAPKVQAPVAQPAATQTPQTNASQAKPATKPAAKKPAGASIKAPLVGIVYFRPNPKKPVFAKVGSHVNKGDIVCQIEAMKVLNNVKAPCSGTITKQLVKNGSMVQYHQPIFSIKKD